MTGPYQPPSDKPGDGGWSGGDINSPFGFGDATAQPAQSNPSKSEAEEPSPYEGVQYELETPAGPALPVQQHPGYPPPGGSPTNPMTSPPMAPPGYPAGPGGPGGPYQSAPPGYGSQPGSPFGQPTPSKNNGWLIGGIAAGLVLLLAVAVVIVVIANNTGDSDNAGNQGNTSDSDTDGGDDPGPDTDGGDDGGDDGADYGDGQYNPQAGLCEQIDMAKFMEQERGFSSFEETAYSTNVSCDAAATYGAIYISIDSATSADAAAERYTTLADIWLSGKANIRDVDGPWDQGTIGEGDVSGSEISMTMVIQAGNMAALINFYNYGDAGSQSGGIDAATDCMKQIMEIAAG